MTSISKIVIAIFVLSLSVNTAFCQNKNKSSKWKGAKMSIDELNKGLDQSLDEGNIDKAIHFIDNGADVNQRTEAGDMPLHKASFLGYISVVDKLIQKGADVNAIITSASDPGATPLHLASMKGNLKIAELLLKNSANPNAKLGSGDQSTAGASPLHLAAAHNRIEIVNLLIKFKANINAVDDIGCTALHYAANKGYSVMINKLIEIGGESMLYTEDNYGRTPKSFIR